MKRWLAKSAATVTLLALITMGLVPPAAEGGVPIPIPYATEFTQIFNHIELIDQYIKQIQQFQTQISQYKNELLHTLNIPNQIFGAVSNDLQQLAQIVKGGQAIAYSMANLNGVFTQRFPGYGLVSKNYGLQYKTWGQTSLDTTLGSLQAAGLQGSQLQNEQNVLNSLRVMSQSAQGRMEAIEVGNQISEQQVEQLMKLREIMLSDLQSKAAYQSAMLQKDLANQANSDAFFGTVQITSDGVKF